MKIKVSLDRSIEKNYFYTEGTQNENKSTVLTFEVPLGYEDFSKRIVFITEDGNFWDYIPENKYEIKNNITKYGTVEAYLWLIKDEQDFRSQKFELNFYDNENADDLIPTEEEIDGFASLINTLELEIQKVEEAISDIKDLTDEYNTNAEEKTKAFNDNVDLKTENFNENAKSKMEDLNNIVAEIDSINFTLDEETGALYVIKQKSN